MEIHIFISSWKAQVYAAYRTVIETINHLSQMILLIKFYYYSMPRQQIVSVIHS